jgi:hypothetical protein
MNAAGVTMDLAKGGCLGYWKHLLTLKGASSEYSAGYEGCSRAGIGTLALVRVNGTRGSEAVLFLSKRRER